jgi:uncharacterized protein YsxB (DUF464 family)
MTKYTIAKGDDFYRIEVKGHAMAGTYGFDIVCSSISTAVALTANLIDKLGFSCNIRTLVHEEGKFIIETDIKENTVIKVMDNLVDYLETVSKQYPKNVKKS